MKKNIKKTLKFNCKPPIQRKPRLTFCNFAFFFFTMWHTIRGENSTVDSFCLFFFLPWSICIWRTHPSGHFLQGSVFSAQSRSVRGLHWPHPSFRDVAQDRTIMSLPGITGREDVSGSFCCCFTLRWNSTMGRWCKGGAASSSPITGWGVLAREQNPHSAKRWRERQTWGHCLSFWIQPSLKQLPVYMNQYTPFCVKTGWSCVSVT